jgi:hypothetical protein
MVFPSPLPVSISKTLAAQLTYDQLMINTPSSANYSFTFWFYGNPITNPIPQNLGNLGFRVFNYGNGTPVIFYGLNNNLIFYGSSYLGSSTDTGGLYGQPIICPIKPQKWHYIVVQYVGGNSVQYFIDGLLIATVPFNSENAPIYNTQSQNTVVVGYSENPPGIASVSNVKYYTNPLTNVDIQNEITTIGPQLVALGVPTM